MATDGATLLRMLESAAQQLSRGARTLDALNVFPVPDGDTGTNMLATVRAALAAAPPPPASAAAVSAAFARGAMEGARGNSGIILSQFFRGFAEALDGRDTCSAGDLAEGFSRAEAYARGAISDPKEGTILTVLADVSRAFGGPVSMKRSSLSSALETAVAAAAASVERTPSLLPVLKESGVVDAGAEGMLLLLQGWMRVLCDGKAAAAQPVLPHAAPHLLPKSSSYGFCTELIVAGEELPLAAMRRRLEEEGTSVILAGDGRAVRVHVHTPRPDDVIAYARSLGTVSRLEVQDMDRQHRDSALAADNPAREQDTAVIALVEGEGLEAVFTSMGSEAVLLGGRPGEPAPSAIVRAISGLSARQVILVPTSASACEAARSAGEPGGKIVRVIAFPDDPAGDRGSRGLQVRPGRGGERGSDAGRARRRPLRGNPRGICRPGSRARAQAGGPRPLVGGGRHDLRRPGRSTRPARGSRCSLPGPVPRLYRRKRARGSARSPARRVPGMTSKGGR